MASTMLQLVQQTTRELGLNVPSAVAASSVTDVVQLLGLLNAVGNELAREHEWQALTKEHRFTTVFYQYTGNSTDGSTTLSGMSSITGLDTNFMVSGTGINTDTYVSSASGTDVVISQAATETATGTTFTFGQTKYTMPSDFDRQIDRTHFDKSKKWEMLGPETSQQWEWLKSSYIATGPRIRYRIMADKFQIWPLPSTNEYLGFDYISNYWVTVTGGSSPSKTSFTVDTDTCVFPDRLMVLGLKLKYFEIKGFDTTAFYRDYDRHLSLSKSNDAGSPSLSMATRMSDVLIGFENIPDSDFGS